MKSIPRIGDLVLLDDSINSLVDGGFTEAVGGSLANLWATNTAPFKSADDVFIEGDE